MSNARLILVALICATPAILLLDGPIMHGLVAGVAAVALVVVARSMRPGETEFLVSIIRPVAAIAAVPALWMLIQVLPLRLFAHPIWMSAETAIGHPITGSISVDTGVGVMALGQYLCIAAVALLAAAVAVDRQRAEWILFSLVLASAAIAVIVTVPDLLGFRLLNLPNGPFARAQALDCSALGLVIAGAAGIRTLERYETRQANPARSVPALLWTFVACGAALAACALALILGATTGILIAAGYGLMALATVVAIRRLGLGRWGTAAIAVPAVGVALLLAAAGPGVRTNSLALAFATTSPTSVSQRMLDDAPATGTGAGTFAALAPIYRDIDDPEAASVPTTTAAIAIELGRPMLWLIAAAAAGAALILLRSALLRGRDSFYPAAGGSALVALLLLSFMNTGLLGTATALIAAATLGLALAQSKSRTVQM